MANSVAPSSPSPSPSPSPSADPAVIAPRYQTRFSCLGGACEDTCCKEWSISIDAEHFRKMRSVLGQTKKDRETFESSVKKIKGPSGTKDRYALIVLNPSTRRCNYLDDKAMCGLHGKYGEKVLPDVCATYPRRQSLVRAADGTPRFEVSSALSCPEAVRQALLPKDAMELVDMDRNTISRDLFVQINNSALEENGEIYDAALDPVRASLLQIISGAPSMAAGLATVAALADALGSGFARKALAPIDAATLLATLEDFARPQVSAQMGTGLAKINVPMDVPIRSLLQLLATRISMPEGHFGSVLAHATRAYGISENTIVSDVSKAFIEHRDPVLPAVAKRFDELLTNYVLQHTFSYWYTHASNLGIYVRGLILRVALIRFLAFAHPDVQALKNAATESDGARTIERVIVEIIYKMARDIDHHGPFMQLLDQALPATMPGLEHALTLLKL
jgi:lysine-N-methylase